MLHTAHTHTHTPHTHTQTHTHIHSICTKPVTSNSVSAGKGKKLFDRRYTSARPSSRDTAQPAAAAGGSPDTRPPEVDEEGYSIRPADASEIKFDDAGENQWSSDSDDEGGSGGSHWTST